MKCFKVSNKTTPVIVEPYRPSPPSIIRAPRISQSDYWSHHPGRPSMRQEIEKLPPAVLDNVYSFYQQNGKYPENKTLKENLWDEFFRLNEEISNKQKEKEEHYQKCCNPQAKDSIYEIPVYILEQQKAYEIEIKRLTDKKKRIQNNIYLEREMRIQQNNNFLETTRSINNSNKIII